MDFRKDFAKLEFFTNCNPKMLENFLPKMPYLRAWAVLNFSQEDPWPILFSLSEHPIVNKLSSLYRPPELQYCQLVVVKYSRHI